MAARKPKHPPMMPPAQIAAGVEALVGGALSSLVDPMPERGGDTRPLLTAQGYQDRAKAILMQFEGVCDRDEIRIVVAMRLRDALDRFIDKNGANWAELLGLMCAYQHHANKLDVAPVRKGGA